MENSPGVFSVNLFKFLYRKGGIQMYISAYFGSEAGRRKRWPSVQAFRPAGISRSSVDWSTRHLRSVCALPVCWGWTSTSFVPWPESDGQGRRVFRGCSQALIPCKQAFPTIGKGLLCRVVFRVVFVPENSRFRPEMCGIKTNIFGIQNPAKH